MAKVSAFVPISILVISGCALSGTSEMSNDAVPAPAVTLEESAPSEAAQSAQFPKGTAPSVYTVTSDDVRRIQMRLREVGFETGSIDGVAGMKTKMAFSRLQSGCAKLDALDPQHPLSSLRRVSAIDTSPSRNDVLQIQTELRSAGFNSGPIDGIYGPRTKTLVAQLPGACGIAKDFHRGLDVTSDHAKSGISSRSPAEAAKASSSQAPRISPEDAARDAGPSQLAQAREEIRVLQLRLRDAGYDPGPFDGIMGTKTRAALAQYETNQRSGKIKTSLTTRISGQY